MQIVAPPRGEERALAAASVVQGLRPVPLPLERVGTDPGEEAR